MSPALAVKSTGRQFPRLVPSLNPQLRANVTSIPMRVPRHSFAPPCAFPVVLIVSA
jgi:hypothetical protein